MGSDGERPSDPRDGARWRDLLRSLEITPSRAMGQNFLHDRKIVRRIVDAAEIGDDSDVFEIGPGLGILTSELVQTARSVTAVELDRRLAPRLREHFGAAARIIEGDILKIDLADATPESPYIVVANLPYSIATAAIQRMLETERPPVRMVIMVQREVAERMVARPPKMSILAVAVQFYATARLIFRIGSGAFIPSPRVESAVVRLDLFSDPPFEPEARTLFFRLVRAGFSQRRKRLDNAISDGLSVRKSEVAEMLRAAEIDPSRRAETLDVADWIRAFARVRGVIAA